MSKRWAEIWARTIGRLERAESVAWQVKLLVFGVDLHVPLKRQYDQLYGKSSGLHNWRRKHSVALPKKPGAGSNGSRRPALASEGCAREVCLGESTHLRAEEAGALVASGRHELQGGRVLFARDANLDEDNFLSYSRAGERYRIFTLIFMVYTCIKFPLVQYLGDYLNERLQLDHPIHCYLVGRFMINENFSNMISLAVAFCVVHWRSSVRFIGRTYRLTSLFFLTLTQHELDQFYARIYEFDPNKLAESRGRPIGVELRDSHTPSIVLTADQAVRLKPRELFILETMCIRQRRLREVVYTLRPNRSPQCLARLRRVLINCFLIGSACIVFEIIAGVAYTLSYALYDQRYLLAYPKCDSHLKRQLLGNGTNWSPHSITPTLHHLISGLADLGENFVLWLELATCPNPLICLEILLNYDLIAYWRLVHAKMERLSAVAKQTGHLSGWKIVAGQTRSGAKECNFSQYRSAIRSLQVEMMDFFSEVERADSIVCDQMFALTTVWLLLSANFVYITQIAAIHEAPLDVSLVVCLLILLSSLVSLSVLTLQHICSKSYVTLCALVAHDRSGHSHSFRILMDMFIERKYCYTLLRSYTYQSTTFLQIIGNSVSCYFLVVSLTKI